MNLKSHPTDVGVETRTTALQLSLSILDDVYHLVSQYKEKDYIRDRETLIRRCDSEGLVFLCSTLPNFFMSFLRHLETGKSTYSSFAVRRATGYPVFLGGLIRLAVEDEQEGVQAFDALYQLCVSFKKLRGPYSETVLKNSVDDFVATDLSLDKVDLVNEFNQDIIRRARDLITDTLLVLDHPASLAKVFKPSPGPGATNTALLHHERYTPLNLRNHDIEGMLYEWMFVNYKHLHDSHHHITGLWERGYCECKSRLKAVPKTFGKPRLICIEENDMQYLQQGMKNALYTVIQEAPLTKGKVNFDDQTINQDYALKGSADRLTCTIDMSAASDRISKKLVYELFADLPYLRYVLMTLSTNVITLLDGTDHECKKFAPMGSGICFPIMSIVHWALIRAIHDLSLFGCNHTDSIHVYGDDIIVAREMYEAVMSILPRFGMKLNQEKSYSQSNFRESCGLDAYKGVRVTPVYIKYTPNFCVSPGEASSIIAVENQLYNKGYLRTAQTIRSCCHIRGFTQLSSPPTTWKRDYVSPPKSRERYNSRLMRWEYRLRCISVKTEYTDACNVSDYERYLRFFVKRPNNAQDWVHKKLTFRWSWVTDSDMHSTQDSSLQRDDPYSPYMEFRKGIVYVNKLGGAYLH